MSYHGDIRLGDTIDIKFTTRSFSTGAPTTLSGTPAVAAYVGNSTTEITAGITLTVDFDARTGLNNVRVVASGANGFATASNYTLAITAGTVGGVSVVGEVVGEFSIENRSALMPTTGGRTLDVSATGEADANVTQWLGAAAATPTVAGVPEVDITHFGGTAGTFAAGRAEVNTSHVGGTLQTAGDIIGDTNDIQARLPAALVGGRMDSSVGSMAAGTVTAAAIATGAIDADALAADAVEKILRSVSGTTDSGSTTTIVDAERTEASTDYWKDAIVVPTSGANIHIPRRISAFDAATDTITVDTAWPSAMGVGDTYIILRTAMQQAAAGGSGDWTATEKEHIRHRLGIDGTATAPTATPSLSTQASVDSVQSDTNDIQTRLPAALVAGRMDSSVGAMAAGTVTAAAVATGAIDADALATDAVNEIADGLLNRDMSLVSDTNSRSPLNALRFLRNKWSISGTTLTVTKEDDVASAWTSTLTATAGADPITASDPA